MRALVIGGNGFIGASLVEHLRDSGVGVRVLDPGVPRPDVDWRGIEFVSGSLASPGILPQALAGVDVVFHLASSTVPSTSNLDPVADVEGNLIGSLQLVCAMVKADVRRIVFFSSGGTVYGNPVVVPVPETHSLAPISSYGVVKVAIENYLTMYQRLGFLDPLILRPSNPYGPRQSTAGVQGAIGAFLRRASVGEPITIWGDGEIVRDYLFVDDLVEFAVRAGLSGRTGTVNVGSGAGISLNQLCEVIVDVVGFPLEIHHLPGREFDVNRIVLDTRLAIDVFGFVPSVPLREGIERTWRAISA